MDKKISELSLEELLALASRPIENTKDLAKRPWIRQFIDAADLEAGDYPLPAKFIFDKYIDWCVANSVKAKSMTAFFLEFRHYFTKSVGRRTEKNAYMMSPKGFDLSPENEARINERSRKYYEKYIGKTNRRKRKNKTEKIESYKENRRAAGRKKKAQEEHPVRESGPSESAED